MTLMIHVDGGSRGNPGPAAVGVAIRDQATDDVVHEAGYFLGTTTNNVAEYRGLLKALEIARAILGASPPDKVPAIHIHSDSQLMVRQVLGEYRVKSADLQPLHAMVLDRLADFDATFGSGKPRSAWRIDHVRREINVRADQLVNQCLDMGEDLVVTDALPGKQARQATKPGKNPPRVPKGSWLHVLPAEGPDESSCPGGSRDGRRWEFEHAAVPGLCLHALTAAFLAGWRPKEGGVSAGETLCSQCGRTVRWGRASD